MGVPGLFAFLSRQYGPAFKPHIQGLSLDAIYLDGNGLLYPIADITKNPQEIGRLLLEAVQEYASTFKCPCHLYIDGPAHMGKIRQQRLRRFMYEPVTMVQDRDAYVPWTPAMFTPGTKMMQDIDSHILTHRDSYPGLGTYSSYREPGEGEHKIIRDLRRLDTRGQKPRIAIVGKDADLLLLGMGLIESYPLSLYILRHNDREMEGAYTASDPMYTIDLTYLRHSILRSYESRTSIWSFIVATFLIGNDFLPPVPEFGAIRESLPIILNLHPVIADQHRIYWDAISRFLREYARAIDSHRAVIYGGWYQIPEGEQPSKNPPSIQVFEDMYYFNMAPFRPNMEGLIQSWTSTILWNYLYYRDGLEGASVSWQYPLHYSPCLETLVHGLQEPKMDVGPGPIPLTPLQSLAAVLPIWLHDLLPSDVAIALKDHPQYYPYAFKRQPPTGDPIIPNIPYNIISTLSS